MHKKITAVGAAVLVTIWAAMTGFAWFGPSKSISEAERRPLAQRPAVTAETVLNGKFMTAFEDFTLDQFPLRDSFRELKSLFHLYIMGQKDNNGIYVADGYAAKLEYPLKQPSINYAAGKFNTLYNSYLKDTGSRVVMAVVPDKGYYLAEKNGYPAMDYQQLMNQMQEKMPWASHVDLTDTLDIQDYYRTDTHWRQEQIFPAARKLAEALGVTAPSPENFKAEALERPFYGVYYGQAALPMKPETMYIMENTLLSQCTVTGPDGVTSQVYNMDKLQSKDLYDVFLSGAQSLLTIENPNAATDRELIVFRDSFGSSMTPLLVQDYKTVTLVDIRYLASQMLPEFIDFHGQDVLFLYSTLVLNSSATLK